ncbi:hypothetical protein PoB_003166600 [Plakobranchus ocellatus]|uniref:Uncharacterized protein n=1 Tax=Plakobranchus ocellatus TaxID=259542 RepID=A0AAV4AEU0_9GAST|nr:hypothetical protein PoB_003166600 [Plakobranchus ocellatus]
MEDFGVNRSSDIDLDLELDLGFDSDFQTFLHRNGDSTPSSSNEHAFSSSSSRQAQGIDFCGFECSKCSKYREDIERMEKEHKENFLFLKRKIINTDMLIRRFKAKQEDIL